MTGSGTLDDCKDRISQNQELMTFEEVLDLIIAAACPFELGFDGWTVSCIWTGAAYFAYTLNRNTYKIANAHYEMKTNFKHGCLVKLGTSVCKCIKVRL